MTYPAATANLVVLWGRWWDHLTKAGVDATITATPLLATGQVGSGSPNLVSLVDQAEIKTGAWTTKPLVESGLWALPLLPTNDAQFGAFGGYRIQCGSEPPFIVEILENTPSMTMSADMIAALNEARAQSSAGAIGISVDDVAQAVWVRQAAVLSQPAVTPPTGVLTSDQVVNLVAGVRQLPPGGTPGQTVTPKAGGGYEWIVGGGGGSALTQRSTTVTAASSAGEKVAAANQIVPLDTSGGTFALTGPSNGGVFGARWRLGAAVPTIAAPVVGGVQYTILGQPSISMGLAPGGSSGELVVWQAFGTDYQPVSGFKPQSALTAQSDARYGPVVSLSPAVGNGTADDTAVLNALLASAGADSVVRGVPGKTYRITAPIVLRSGGRQTLDMTGCTVLLDAPGNMLRNAAVDAVRRVLDAVTTAGSTTLTSATASFVSGDAGKPVTVQGAGPGGAPLTTTIASVTNATTAVLATASATAVTGQYVAIGARERDIRVVGGTWNRQGYNGTPTNSVDAHTMRFRHVDGLTVDRATFYSTGGKYQVNPGDCTDIRIIDMRCPSVSSDGVHFNGPCRDILVRGISGGLMGDDLVSFTARDSTAVITDCAGDLTDIVIEAASFREAMPNLYASVLKLVAGKTTDGSADYRTARVRAHDLSGPNTTADVVYMGDPSGGVFEDIVLDGVRSYGGSNRGCVILHGGTIDRVTIRDAVPHPTDPHMVSVDAPVNRLRVEDTTWVQTGSTSRLVWVAASTVKRLLLTGTQMSATDGRLVHIDNGATVERLVIDNATVDGARCVSTGTTGVTLTSFEVSNLVAVAVAIPLGQIGAVTALVAANIAATGMTAWVQAIGTGAVTVLGASGLVGDNDTYLGNVLPAARASNVFTTEPTSLAVGEETLPRLLAQGAANTGSGNLVLTYFTARKTETIGQVKSYTTTPAGSGGTLARVGVYEVAANGDLTLIASTANDTTMWASTFATFTRALQATFGKVAGKRYALGFLFVGGTGPSWRGCLPPAHADAPRLNGTVTGQSDLPASIGGGSVVANAGISALGVLLP